MSRVALQWRQRNAVLLLSLFVRSSTACTSVFTIYQADPDNSATRVTWDESKALCEGQGLILAEPRSLACGEALRAAIRNSGPSSTPQDTWIGVDGKDQNGNNDGNWYWASTYTTVDFSAAGVSTPSGSGRCVSIKMEVRRRWRSPLATTPPLHS